MARLSAMSRIAAIAEDQWGLVTRRQAKLAGVSDATLTRITDGTALERVAHGVFHLVGAPLPDLLQLRAAWLQLAPETPAWQRRPDQGVVSHRSAAAAYSLGHLPADGYDFTLPHRRQSRRSDVRLHKRALLSRDWIDLRGLPVTRPARIASDLLRDREDPEAVAYLIGDAIRGAYEYPEAFVDSLAPYAARFGLRRGEGYALMQWMLDLLADPDATTWLEQARAANTSHSVHDQRQAAK